MDKTIIIFLCICVCLCLCSKLDNNLSQGIMLVNKKILISKIQSIHQQFSIPFSNSNYQLSAQILQSYSDISHNQLSSQSQSPSVYNASLYNKSKSCRYYKSLFSINPIKDYQLNYIIQSTLYLPQHNHIYILVITNHQISSINTTNNNIHNSRFLLIYQYQNHILSLLNNISLTNTKLSNDLDQTLLITQINSQIILTDGTYIYSLNYYNNNNNHNDYNNNTTNNTTTNNTTINNNTNNTTINDEQNDRINLKQVLSNQIEQILKDQQLLGFKRVSLKQKQLLLFLFTHKIIFYEYNSHQNSIKKYLTINNTNYVNKKTNGNNDSDINRRDQMHMFQDVQLIQQKGIILILSGNKLYEYNINMKEINNNIVHQLDGDKCTRIFIHEGKILHIICQYNKENYIAQLYFNNQNQSNSTNTSKLILNRYYTDIQNYRNLYYLNNYMLMIGQNQIIIQSNSVNRKLLLQLKNNPYTQKFTSFAINNIIFLNNNNNNNNNNNDNNSNNNNHHLNTHFTNKIMMLAVRQNQLSIFQLQLHSPQIWCQIDRLPYSHQLNLLLIQNISQCQLNTHKPLLQTICTNLYPIEIAFQRYELQQKQSILLAILLIIIVFVLAFFCLGCVFKQNGAYNKLVEQIKVKINKVKKKSKSIKSI